jgi:hypothetical protein
MTQFAAAVVADYACTGAADVSAAGNCSLVMWEGEEFLAGKVECHAVSCRHQFVSKVDLSVHQLSQTAAGPHSG